MSVETIIQSRRTNKFVDSILSWSQPAPTRRGIGVLTSVRGPHRRNPALVQMSAVKGRPEMADVWPKRRDWRAGFGNCAPAGRRQHMFGHKEVRYGDNSYPSRS